MSSNSLVPLFSLLARLGSWSVWPCCYLKFPSENGIWFLVTQTYSFDFHLTPFFFLFLVLLSWRKRKEEWRRKRGREWERGNERKRLKKQKERGGGGEIEIEKDECWQFMLYVLPAFNKLEEEINYWDKGTRKCRIEWVEKSLGKLDKNRIARGSVMSQCIDIPLIDEQCEHLFCFTSLTGQDWGHYIWQIIQIYYLIFSFLF